MVDKNKITNIQLQLGSGEEFSLGAKHDELAETIVEFSEDTLGLDSNKPEDFNQKINQELTNRIVEHIDEQNIAIPSGGFEITDVKLISFKTD